MIDVGIIGASGYTGVELLRLCHSHPELNVVFATGDSQAGNRIAQLYPSLAGGYPDEVFVPWKKGPTTWSHCSYVVGLWFALPAAAIDSAIDGVRACS